MGAERELTRTSARILLTVLKTWSAREAPTVHLFRMLILSSRSWDSALRVRVAIITCVLAGWWGLSSMMRAVKQKGRIRTHQSVWGGASLARGRVTTRGYGYQSYTSRPRAGVVDA